MPWIETIGLGMDEKIDPCLSGLRPINLLEGAGNRTIGTYHITLEGATKLSVGRYVGLEAGIITNSRAARDKTPSNISEVRRETIQHFRLP